MGTHRITLDHCITRDTSLSSGMRIVKKRTDYFLFKPSLDSDGTFLEELTSYDIMKQIKDTDANEIRKILMFKMLVSVYPTLRSILVRNTNFISIDETECKNTDYSSHKRQVPRDTYLAIFDTSNESDTLAEMLNKRDINDILSEVEDVVKRINKNRIIIYNCVRDGIFNYIKLEDDQKPEDV